jgi:acyl-CoA synthetase (NDP forming)
MLETYGHFILEPEAIRLLGEYNIPYPDHKVAQNADEAVACADQMGYPVVLKIVSPDVPHKSDAGGVAVGLKDAEGVRQGFNRVLERVKAAVPGASIEGVLVCRQALDGLEVIVGALHDTTFGPTVMFGLGGIFTEVLKDVAFRVAPLARRDAEQMVSEIRGYPLLAGARGQAEKDVHALVDLLLAVSQLVTEKPEVKELDLNPVRLYEQGLLVLDARVFVR